MKGKDGKYYYTDDDTGEVSLKGNGMPRIQPLRIGTKLPNQ
jgi:hypothetical protein